MSLFNRFKKQVPLTDKVKSLTEQINEIESILEDYFMTIDLDKLEKEFGEHIIAHAFQFVHDGYTIHDALLEYWKDWYTIAERAEQYEEAKSKIKIY